MKLWTGLVIFALAGDIMMMAIINHDPYHWWTDDPHAEPLTTLVFLDVEKPERDTVDPKYRVEVPDNHSLWRHDGRCGFYGHYFMWTLNLLSDNITVAQCDPDGSYPCCGGWGRCGSTSSHCDCNGCIDYRKISERRKSVFRKVQIEARLKKLDEDLALADEVSKEKKAMEEKVSDLSQALAEEEEKSKHLAELKEKHETSLSDLEERLNKEHIALQESNKEFEALKATTAAEQELRTKREQELALLKKSLEEESGHHESQLMEMRQKHSQELAVLQEQMDNAKKIMEALEKAKATLAAENADMANEIKSIATSKAETDRKSQHLESQVIELEKTQRNFDKILAEEKAISERFASERDAAERDAREKETKLEEYIVKVEELQRSRRVLQTELIRRILHNIH